MDILTYALAKKYVDKTIEGSGALKGKNCIITDISPITGGNRVTFQWTLDDGTVETDTMDVMDGEDGLGIKSVNINAQNHLIVTYDDDTTWDAGLIEGGGGSDPIVLTYQQWLVLTPEQQESGEYVVQGYPGSDGDESSDIPSYYQTEYNTTKANVESHSTNDSYNVLFMTDLHYSAEGTGYYESQLRDPVFRTIKAAKKFCKEMPVTNFVLGGDYMQLGSANLQKENGISNLIDINYAFDDIQIPFFPVQGNHEQHYDGSAQGVGLTDSEVYQYLSKKWVGRNGIRKTSSINMFYRLDDVNQVCHVYISVHGQADLYTVITNYFSEIVTANTGNYPYIIYDHFGTAGTPSGASGIYILDKVKDSIDYIKDTLGKTTIAWVTGHAHTDAALPYNGVLVISIINSCVWNTCESQDGQTYDKTVGTSNESAFTVLTFVPTTGKVFITRFGTGVDFECNYNTISGPVGRIGYIPISTCSVTQTLSGGVTSSNASTTTSTGIAYTNTLSVPDNHFTFGTVTVTMDGIDITSTAYDSTTHVISIALVTGDIVITATATNDYYWTPLDSTITQFDGSAQATYSLEANDLSLTCPYNATGSGLRLKKTLTSAPTQNIALKLICDSATYSEPGKHIFMVQIRFGNATTATLEQQTYFSQSTEGYTDALVSGIIRYFHTSSNIQDATWIEVFIRTTGNSVTSADFPATINLENLRLEVV